MAKYPRRPYTVNFSKEAIADDTWYILVDKSNTSLYSHPSGTSSFNLLSVDLSTEKATDGDYDIWFGVVYENDATDGSMALIHCWHVEAVGNPTDSDDRFVDHLDFTIGNPRGLDLSLVNEVLGSTLLTNGDFEDYTSDELDDWTESNCDTAEDESGQTGSAVQISVTANDGEIAQTVAVSAGRLHKLQFYYKNTAGGDLAQYSIYDLTNSADIIADTEMADKNDAFSAIQTVYFVTPDACTSISIRFGAKTNTDIVWFDTATLKEVTTIEGPVYLRGYRVVDKTGLQSDAKNLSTAMGLNWANGGDQFSAAVGDIVMWVEEVTGGTIDISMTLTYTCN